MVRPPLESNNTIKYLCSYGGKIIPRHPDGKLRYQGGHTRVLALPRSISFHELIQKMGELCGTNVSLRCQLPTEDLDALITIKSDEDLANLIEEYDLAASNATTSSSSSKVRAFLSSKQTILSPSPSVSPTSLSPKSLSPSSSFASAGSSPRFTPPSPPVLAYPVTYSRSSSGKKLSNNHPSFGCHHCCRNTSHVYLIHNGNHWQ